MATRQRLPGGQRREQILQAALELFRTRSFDAVGMRDVAAACSMSPTGIYWHFANKEALLIGLFDRLSDQLLDGVRTASRVADPRARLAGLVDFHVDQSLSEPALIPIYQREEAGLQPTERARVRQVLREYLAAWTDALVEYRPDLSPEAARTIVVAIFGMLNSTAFHRSDLSGRPLRALLIGLADRVIDPP
ncbi:TetR/AcrR family transcriptional regulator [Patulibacter minatonensis]|uniref:TetR/AcrR family transcriptional regulator n=1 Tax=Patulibacter minatonensis TaxID=298163 RepID=UPI0004ADD144|nr:TetR/AcrR family transcriptional regulator [Patulibacter minatonensis]